MLKKVSLLILIVAFCVFSQSYIRERSFVFSQNFDSDSTGVYTEEKLARDFAKPAWSMGVKEGRVSIVEGSEAYKGKSLKVLYPKGKFGPEGGGAEWILKFDKSYQELYCSYRIKFSKNFEFVKGGKIPGLAGGKGNTGGHPPNGKDGWSARMMWRMGGQIIQYLYHPEQAGKYGDDLKWTDESEFPLYFSPRRWYLVEHHIIMNTPGQHDGIIETWLDGKPALKKTGIRFRDIDSFAIDMFQFSTFFGGGDDSWSAVKDEYIYFDDFIISEEKIGD
jgi:hypothetical protein